MDEPGKILQSRDNFLGINAAAQCQIRLEDNHPPHIWRRKPSCLPLVYGQCWIIAVLRYFYYFSSWPNADRTSVLEETGDTILCDIGSISTDLAKSPTTAPEAGGMIGTQVCYEERDVVRSDESHSMSATELASQNPLCNLTFNCLAQSDTY